jgi:hypothetical protein
MDRFHVGSFAHLHLGMNSEAHSSNPLKRVEELCGVRILVRFNGLSTVSLGMNSEVGQLDRSAKGLPFSRELRRSLTALLSLKIDLTDH